VPERLHPRRRRCRARRARPLAVRRGRRDPGHPAGPAPRPAGLRWRARALL
ncbi:MAG: hypothetical protein AVDCRST_MAG06-1291, partial [uncultured Nocardioides sp.]